MHKKVTILHSRVSIYQFFSIQKFNILIRLLFVYDRHLNYKSYIYL